MKPIVKWAGGKNKIYDEFKTLLQSSNYNRYIDLFCGSLSLPLLFLPKQAVFNDINSALINVYKVIKTDLNNLLDELKKINSIEYNNKETFDRLRTEFNENRKEVKDKTRYAALFLYLNKRCFNGLYRENRCGKYNVPYRKYNNDIYCEEELEELNKYLNENDIRLSSKSFTRFDINFFKQGDLVYLDPPYYKSEKSAFTSYWKTPFLVEEQKKLLEFCKQLDSKGIKFILSNSPCTEICEMYREFNQKMFYIGRQMRNAKGKSKTFECKNQPNEILIWNFSRIDFLE